MIDVEADGPVPGIYSMVSFAGVVVEPGLDTHFLRNIHPVTEDWLPESLKVAGLTREETLAFGDPYTAMKEFAQWLEEHGGKEPRFISDNNGFDWSFIAYYFHRYLGRNPFGYRSEHIGTLYKGMRKDMFESFKPLRTTPYTHNALDDAISNATALLVMKDLGLKISFKRK